MKALDDLMTRAGASDHDREAWLAERNRGVTATQVRDLTVKGSAFRAELLQKKRDGVIDPPLTSPAAVWGNEREPIIAEWVSRKYGIEPESRVFHHADEPRYLASPDGIGLAVLPGKKRRQLVISEIKTSWDLKTPGSAQFEKAGYNLQMQWTMFVTGAAACLYVLEQHDNEWRVCEDGIERPGLWLNPFSGDATEPQREVSWVLRDEATIAQLRKTADEFLHDLENPPIDPAPFEAPLQMLLRAKERRDETLADVAKWEGELVDLLPAGGSVEVPELGKVTVSIPKPGRRFDSKAFRADHKDLFERYQTTTAPGKPRVTATPKKENDDEQ